MCLTFYSRKIEKNTKFVVLMQFYYMKNNNFSNWKWKRSVPFIFKKRFEDADLFNFFPLFYFIVEEIRGLVDFNEK